MLIVFLIILVVCLIYFIRINGNVVEDVQPVVKDELEDLRDIAEAIDKAPEKPVTFTPYEKEQEEKAIISYDELLSNTGEYQLNYVNEEKKDDVLVKKVDLNNITSNSKLEITRDPIHLFTLEKEEAFLKALKELQKSL